MATTDKKSKTTKAAAKKTAAPKKAAPAKGKATKSAAATKAKATKTVATKAATKKAVAPKKAAPAKGKATKSAAATKAKATKTVATKAPAKKAAAPKKAAPAKGKATKSAAATKAKATKTVATKTVATKAVAKKTATVKTKDSATGSTKAASIKTAAMSGSSREKLGGLSKSQWQRLSLVAASVLFLVLPWIVSDFRSYQFSLTFIYAIVLLGLNILTGFNGQFSLGHGAFYALGAYTTAIMVDQWEIPYGWTIPVAGLICLFAGFLFGIPALRIEGHYLALATLALAQAIPSLLKYHAFEDYTGGVQGIVMDKPEAPWGLPLNADQWLYYLCLFVLVIGFIASWNILNSRTGRAMKAIRDNHTAAVAMGVNTSLYKTWTFGLSALYTGIAGALSAIVVQFVAPDSFGVFLSITFLVGSVVGGMSTISGAIYGGLFIQFIPNVADVISKSAPWAIYGVIMIVFMFVMPMGIAGFLRILWGKIWAKYNQTEAAGQE